MATVDASKGGYEAHPDSYSPRVFVYVKATDINYELLRTGEAVPWVSKDPTGTFWVMDVERLADVGVHRDASGIEPHVAHDVEL